MLKYIVLFLTLLLLTGCASGIAVVETDRQEYFSEGMIKSDKSLLPSSSNILANFLLQDEYENNPEQL